MLGTIFVSILFLIVGGVTALVGYKVFRVLLPILGLFVGFSVGFSGMQAVFGTGQVSFVLSVITALVVGLILALLSYAYFKIAIVVLGAIVGAGVMTTLANAIGLQEDGFLTFLLAASGAIITGLFVAALSLEKDLVIVVSAMVGVALIFVGVFLLVTDLTLEELHANGVRTSFQEIVDSHFVWLMAWLGGTLASVLAQYRTALLEFRDDAYVLKMDD
jgi:hypothetical protein